MKYLKTIVIILMFVFYKSSVGQHFHKENPIALTFGHGGINNLNFQFEKPISDIYSLGSNIRTYYTLDQKFNLNFTGPMFEFFLRNYFDDQGYHIGNYFFQIDLSYGKMNLPYNSKKDDVLYDINNILVLDNTGQMIQIYNDELYRTGFGLSVGYKKISCKDWIWEVSLGLDYWQTPKYYSEEYLLWVDDNCCNFTNYKESRWTNGFPLDLQIRIGRLIQ